MAPKSAEVLPSVLPVVLWLVGLPLALATLLCLALPIAHKWHEEARVARQRQIFSLAASQREEDRALARSLQQWLDDDDYLRIAGAAVWYPAQFKAFGLWLVSCSRCCLRSILECLNNWCCSTCGCAALVLRYWRKARRAAMADEERLDPPPSTAEPVVRVQPGQLSTMTIQGGSRRQNQPGSEESGKSDKQA